MSSFLQHRRKPFSVLGLLKGEAKGWYDTTASTLKTDAVATLVTANSEYLSTTTVGAETGDITLSGWFVTDSILNQGDVFSRWGTDRWIMVVRVADKLYLYWTKVINSTVGPLIHTATLTAGTLYHWAVVHTDSTDIKFYLNGAVVSSTDVTTLRAGSGVPIYLAGRNSSPQYWDGDFSMVSKWARALSGTEITAIYNSGVPREYADLTTAEKVSMEYFWHLNEPSGTRYDAHGSNNLTDNNTVGVTTGTVEYTATENAAITKWENQAGNASPFADLTKTAATLSPILSSGIPDWYNAAHALKSATGSMTQIHTIIALVNLNATATADTIVDGFGATNRGLIDHSTPGLSYLFAGTVLFGPAIASGRRLYIGELNGASSSLKITGYSDTTGDAGTGSMSGASVGAPNSNVSPFNGTIESVILIDRALTSQEIAALQAL